MSDAHARLGPSNHRWPHCPGSVREEANYPDIAGAAAVDGTGSHLLLEMCLENNVPAEHYLDQIIGVNHPDQPNGWLVKLDRCRRVQLCLDYVQERVTELKKNYPDVRVIAESKSDPGGAFGIDDWWGTCDITILCFLENQTLGYCEVIDYKDGQMYVHHVDNSQLIAYMFGKLRPFIASGPDLVKPFRSNLIPLVRMTIVQPKCEKKPIRYQDTSADDVTNQADKLATAAYATTKPDAPLIPDNKGGKGYCKWCKHKPNCPAQKQRDIGVMQELSNNADLSVLSQQINVADMNNQDLAKLADAEAGIMEIFDRAKQEIQERIERGETVDGYEMKAGNASKVWAEDEEKTVKALKSRGLKQADIYPQKLLSPAQALKKLDPKKRDRFTKDYIVEKVGDLKLTRTAYKKKSAEQLFSGVTFVDDNALQSQTPALQCDNDVKPLSFL